MRTESVSRVSLSNRRAKEIASLGQKKYRDRLGQTLVEGVRSVEAAVQAGAPLVDLVVTEAAQEIARVQALLEAMTGPVYVVAEREIAWLSEVATSQGVLAVVETHWFPEEHLSTLDTVLALDGVQDPGNVGTLLRTAAWFGVEAVLAGPGTADLYHPKVVRAAMGGLWDVHRARTNDLSAVLDVLRQHGFSRYGADLNGTAARYWTPAKPSVLVLGSEAHGLSAAVQATLDERVAIRGGTGRAGTESLNVAVAGGIILYAWLGDRL